MGKRTEQSFFKGRSPNSQKLQEEMLNIPGHKGNANKNHVKIPPHSALNGYDQEHTQQQMLARMGREKNPRTLLVGI
jgi:hypothetical protein